MANFRTLATARKLLLCGTIATVSLGSVTPVYALPTHKAAVNLNDVALALRLEKLIEKANKYFKANDSKNMLEVMCDLKTEVEGYTNQQIDLDHHLDIIEKEMKKNGAKYSKSEMKQVRAVIKKSEKKHNHKALYMANSLEHDLEYDEALMNIEYDYLCRAAKSKEKDDTEEMALPVRVTVGVTMALCGLFITIIPIPICRTYGPQIVTAGIMLAVEGTCNRVEEDRKNQQDKK